MQSRREEELRELIILIREQAEQLDDRAESILTTKNQPLEDRSAIYQSLQLLSHRAHAYADYLDNCRLMSELEPESEDPF